MKNLELWKAVPIMLVVMLSVLASYAQQQQPQRKSAESSPTSDTRVKSKPSAVNSQQGNEEVLTACNAAADELRAARILIDALEAESRALRSRLDTEQRTTQLLGQLNETRARESEALNETVAAKNETINAKDAAIAAQAKLIDQLRTKKRSVWSRVGDILIGAAAVAIIK